MRLFIVTNRNNSMDIQYFLEGKNVEEYLRARMTERFYILSVETDQFEVLKQ